GRGELKGAADTATPHVARRQAGNVLAVEQDPARVRGELAVDHVETGRLARAVRSDHGEKVAGADVEARLVDGVNAAEGFAERADREHSHGACLRLNNADAAPAMPCGKASTSTRMMPPSSARQYSVWRITVSCNVAKTDAPTIGPVSVWMPPSSTMTSPSIERPTLIVSGDIE